MSPRNDTATATRPLELNGEFPFASQDKYGMLFQQVHLSARPSSPAASIGRTRCAHLGRTLHWRSREVLEPDIQSRGLRFADLLRFEAALHPHVPPRARRQITHGGCGRTCSDLTTTFAKPRNAHTPGSMRGQGTSALAHKCTRLTLWVQAHEHRPFALSALVVNLAYPSSLRLAPRPLARVHPRLPRASP